MQRVPAINRLIEMLPRKEREQLLDQSETVDFAFGETLCNPGDTVGYAWFPLTGLISRGTTVANRPPMEIGMSGNEGMLGEILAIGIDASPWYAMGQSDGTAVRIPAADFIALNGECPELQRAAYHYLYEMITMAARSMPCTRFHRVEARLARWLLMTDDRTRADHFNMTHQFLADMLGVQRSAVTIAAGALQAQGLIHYSRGRISIVSRTGLEAASCECYAGANGDYAGQYYAGQYAT